MTAAIGPHARAVAGAPSAALRTAPVGIVPILWNNADLPDLAPRIDADVVLDEISRLGFSGTQLGLGFPEGTQLVAALRRRGLRLAEVYAALPCARDGPAADAAEVARRRLATLDAAAGEVLVVALEPTPDRERVAGALGDVPRLIDAAWTRLAALLDEIGRDAARLGHRLAFHPHAGTFVERPDEVERLVAMTDPRHVGLCLDVGHFIVGGGDPVDAIARFGRRIVHVHLKDVARAPLSELRELRGGGFLGALQSRIFVELGAGVLELDGVLRALAGQDYRGWLMVEQDTTWRPPSESAAISRQVLDYALRHLDRAAA